MFISNLLSLAKYPEIMSGNLSYLPPVSSFYTELKQRKEFPPVLTEQIFMVDRSFVDVVRMFCPHIPYSKLYLIDKSTSKHFHYYVPILPRLDKIEHTTRLDIFMTSNKEIVVSLPFVESLLRRNIKGFRIYRAAMP